MKKIVGLALLSASFNSLAMCPNGSQFRYSNDQIEAALKNLQSKVASKQLYCKTYEYNYQTNQYEVKEDLGVFTRLEYTMPSRSELEYTPDNREAISLGLYGANGKSITGHNACIFDYSKEDSSNGKAGISFYDKLPTLDCEYVKQ